VETIEAPACDAVIAWVDGYDETYIRKLNSYLDKLGLKERPIEALPTRFNQ
jgi:hypothetical protein